MKKSFLMSMAICMLIANTVFSQGLLKKVTGAMKDELLNTGKSGGKAPSEPEPSCACDQAELILGLGGKLQLDYKEISVSTMDDGSLLVRDKISGNYYIVKSGVTKGPLQAGDPAIAEFDNADTDNSGKDALMQRYKGYINKSGDKYLITFGGETYGPYAQISQFAVSKSKDKFAALVVENIVLTEDDGKKLEEAIKNAKNDQERMDLGIQYSQMVQQKMMNGGGAASIMPKLVTNISNTSYDPQSGGTFTGEMKYDDILINMYDKVVDMQGNTILTLKPEFAGGNNLFVSSPNERYAYYNYGTLTFNDKTSLAGLFNPHLMKADGKVYLAYMYYSPKKNAIMQCKILF
jgi:hypothetical protein